MTTFATLKTDISEYMARDDITESLANTFVRIAEAEIRRTVRIGAMETTDTSFSVTAQVTDLPTGFISMRALANNAVNQREMDFLPPARLRSSVIMDQTAQQPTAYTIEGETLVVAPTPPSGGVTLSMVYYKAFDALSEGTDTNWLLTYAYDVYLYSSIRAACEWALDEQREMMFAAKASEAIEESNREDRWSRVSGSALIRTGGGGNP